MVPHSSTGSQQRFFSNCLVSSSCFSSFQLHATGRRTMQGELFAVVLYFCAVSCNAWTGHCPSVIRHQLLLITLVERLHLTIPLLCFSLVLAADKLRGHHDILLSFCGTSSPHFPTLKKSAASLLLEKNGSCHQALVEYC